MWTSLPHSSLANSRLASPYLAHPKVGSNAGGIVLAGSPLPFALDDISPFSHSNSGKYPINLSSRFAPRYAVKGTARLMRLNYILFTANLFISLPMSSLAISRGHVFINLVPVSSPAHICKNMSLISLYYPRFAYNRNVSKRSVSSDSRIAYMLWWPFSVTSTVDASSESRPTVSALRLANNSVTSPLLPTSPRLVANSNIKSFIYTNSHPA